MACSLDRSELAAWAAEEGGPVPVECAVCRPGDPLAARPPPPTKLAREVLEYVLESALIHLEPDCPPYRLTVGDISACFGKSPGQLAGALHQLIDAGYLAVRSPQTAGTIQPQRLVLPTRAALRTVESLQAESGEALDAELARLSGGPAT